MQVETAVDEAYEKREEYFRTLYDEIARWAGREGMTQLVSFLPQRIRRYGRDMAIDLEKGGIWSKDNLTFGMGVGGFHDIKKLNFGAYRSSVEEITGPHAFFQKTLGPNLLADLVYQGNLMSGEFKSYVPGDYVWVNCWANDRMFGGDNLDGSNPYSLVGVVARTIRQGR
jgi:hypothetical protein